MDTFNVTIQMQVNADIAALQDFAHGQLQAMADAKPGIETQLGPGATAQEIADFYTHNPGTVVSAVIRAVLAHGISPFDGAILIGPNLIDSVPVE